MWFKMKDDTCLQSIILIVEEVILKGVVLV